MNSSKPLLTIGMAVYDDFDGAWFTTNTLIATNRDAMPRVELIVVDNHPDSVHGKAVKHEIGYFQQDLVHSVNYIAMPEPVGTSAPRDRIFREATADAVLCIDAHVLFDATCNVPGGSPSIIQRLIDWYAMHPDCRDLIQGPMIFPDRRNMHTHFDDVWRAEMWGTWGTDYRADPNHPLYREEGFEIGACGLGLFSCRKEAWLGFNPRFRGFGGEEWYIHEKYRQAGRKCLCLPWLRWLHRFRPPEMGVPYPNSPWLKVRNYVIGHAELGLPFDRIKAEFVDVDKLSNNAPALPLADWEELMANPSDPPEWPKGREPVRFTNGEKKGCKSCGQARPSQVLPESVTLETLYQHAAKTPSDINEHCAKLRELATGCDTVCEFGMRRGVSTVALLAGQPKRLVSYDRNYDPIADVLKQRQGATTFEFVEGDSLTVDIPECDLLFIDTKHTADHFWQELARHAGKAKRVAFHDSEIYGLRGDDGGPGLLVALEKFLRENMEWSVVYDVRNNHGFTVISRDPADRPPLPGKIEMAVNFARAMAKHVVTGAHHASAEKMEERLKICTLCIRRAGERCSACGCPLEDKASLESSYCPMGRWPVDGTMPEGEPA